PKGNANLGERSRSNCHYPSRRALADVLYWPRYRPLVGVDFVGVRNRGCVGGGGRRIGLSHWVRPRSGLRCVRETAALVNYSHRFPGRSSRRIILSRLRDRTAADDRAWAILVRHNSVGDFLARPLVRRRSKYSYRVCGRYNFDGILSVAL